MRPCLHELGLRHPARLPRRQVAAGETGREALTSATRRAADREATPARWPPTHALAGRHLAPLRRRPADNPHPRDVRRADGPCALQRPRIRAFDEPEPRHEVSLAVAQEVARPRRRGGRSGARSGR